MQVTSHSSAADGKKIGILVLTQFFGMEDESFVRTACSHDKLLPPLSDISVKWRNSDQHPEGDMSFFSCEYIWLHPKKYKLTLLGVPHSLQNDFLLSDLQFPFRVAGCVLIVDLHKAYSMKAHITHQGDSLPLEERIEFQKIWEREANRSKELFAEWVIAEFRKRMNLWWMGGIAWIKMNRLPFVVVFIESKPPAMAPDEMLNLLELEPHIQVISCSFKMRDRAVAPAIAPDEELTDLDEIEKRMSAIPYPLEFNSEDVEKVLSVLVDQIEVEGFHH